MMLKKVLKYLLPGLFILVQVYLLFFQPLEVLDYPRYLNEHPLPLFGKNNDVSQEFRSSGPLARIDVMLANYLKKPESGNLQLSIFKKDRLVFSKDYPADTAEDNRFYSFPVDASIPRGNYRLKLNYAREKESDKLAAWISNKKLYPYGNLYVNGVKRDGSMTFRVYYRSTIWNERNRWLNSVPQFPARPYILLTGFLLLLFMVNLLFHNVTKSLIQESSNKTIGQQSDIRHNIGK